MLGFIIYDVYANGLILTKWTHSNLLLGRTNTIKLDHQYTKTFDDVDDREIDVESEDDERSKSPVSGVINSSNKRAHHNALERKRRDHIKESFNGLRDSVPFLDGEKSSRAQILNKATEYIQVMRRNNISHQQDIDDLKKQNKLLEQQIRELEKSSQSFQTSQDSTEFEASPQMPPESS